MTQHEALSRRIASFAQTRDWDHFRSPKNLALALDVAAGELREHFLWLTQGESRALPAARRAAVQDELGAVFIYLVRLADELGLDLHAAAAGRLADYELSYPVARRRRGGGKRSEAEG